VGSRDYIEWTLYEGGKQRSMVPGEQLQNFAHSGRYGIKCYGSNLLNFIYTSINSYIVLLICTVALNISINSTFEKEA
jgi:hypothetical protein